jgi:hypothetical protein
MFLYRIYRIVFLFCLIIGSFDAAAGLFNFVCDLPERTQAFRMTRYGIPLPEPERMPVYFELLCRGNLPEILEIRFRNVPIGRILAGNDSISFWTYFSAPIVQVLDDNFSISCDNDGGRIGPYIILVRMNTNFSTWLFRRVARVFTRRQ